MTTMISPIATRAMTRRRAAEKGQAFVEFLVAAIFFLVPLILAIIVLGKFADVRHTNVMAARYATWEETVWYNGNTEKFTAINNPNRKSTAEIQNEISVRILNDRSSATGVIKNTDRSATSFINGIDPMWHDVSHHAFLDQYNQQSTTITHQAPAGDLGGQALGAVEALPLPTGVTGTLVPPVPTNNLAVANVSIGRVAYNSTSLQRLWPQSGVWGQNWVGLDFSAPGGILSNTWGANGSSSTHDMVAESVPTAKGLGTAVGNVVNAAMDVWDPTMPNAEWGKITPDVTPPDRLKN